MTSKSQTMPGGDLVGESPVKGEPKPKTGKAKPGYTMQLITEPPKLMTTSGLSDSWGRGDMLSDKERRTRSQTKETGPASPGNQRAMTPLIPTWPLPPTTSGKGKEKATTVSAKDDTVMTSQVSDVSLDRPEQGGDGPEERQQIVPSSLDRSKEKDGGRQESQKVLPPEEGDEEGDDDGDDEEEGKEEKGIIPPADIAERPNNTEGVPISLDDPSPPEIHIPEGSDKEIEDILGDGNEANANNVTDQDWNIVPPSSNHKPATNKAEDSPNKSPGARYFPLSFDNQNPVDEVPGIETNEPLPVSRVIYVPEKYSPSGKIFLDDEQWRQYLDIGHNKVLLAITLMYERFGVHAIDSTLGEDGEVNKYTLYLSELIESGVFDSDKVNARQLCHTIDVPKEVSDEGKVRVTDEEWERYNIVGHEETIRALKYMKRKFGFSCLSTVLGNEEENDKQTNYLRKLVLDGYLGPGILKRREREILEPREDVPINPEPVVLLAAMAVANDVDPNEEGTSKKPRSKRQSRKGNHDDAMEKLALINANARKDATASRPMDQVHREYGQNLTIPEGLTGSISVSLAARNERNEERKKREKAKRAAAKAKTRAEAEARDSRSVPVPPANAQTTAIRPVPGSSGNTNPPLHLRSSLVQTTSTNPTPAGLKSRPGPRSNQNGASGSHQNHGTPVPPHQKAPTPAPSQTSKGKKPKKKPRKRKPSYSGSSGSSSSGTSNSIPSHRTPSLPSMSGSSSSSSSSGTSGGSKKHRKRCYKKKRNRDSGVKMKLPEPYDGKADLDAFDQWTFRVTNYAKVMQVSDKTMIRVMADLVTGKAQGFYMDYVAMRQSRWTLATLFPAMFDYCFPNDIMQRLRKKWDNMTQGKSRVQDYARDMEKLARKFKEANERTVVLAIWKGLNANIRKHMILMGIDPEIDDLNTVIDKALISEKARDQMERVSKESERYTGGETSKPKREWTRFKNRSGGSKNFNPETSDSEPQTLTSDEVRANAVSPQNAPEYKPKTGPSNKRLPRAKLDELRAEGKCFNCQQPGHEQWNCPKLHSMRPPRPMVNIGSVSFSKTAAKKDKADVFFGSVAIAESDQIVDKLKEYEDLELKVHHICEKVWGLDPLWYNEETRHECKYSVCVDDEEISVWNFVHHEDRTFARKDLDDPKFDIAEILASPKPNRTPTSVREGGYPVIENYNRWDWPAIKWMHARLNGQLHYADEGNAPEGVKDEHRIDVQPTMFGYSIQLDESDVIYNVTHEEVLDPRFSPEWTIDHMLAARNVLPESRGDRFEDKRFSNYVSLMLGMTRIPGQQTRIKKRGDKKRVLDPEGAAAIERTTPRVKDKTRRLPEPIVIQVNINGNPIRALLDTGSMADFLSTTVVDQLRLPRVTYEKPLSVQLAVHGSRSKINCGTTVNFQYQTIDCDRRFDIVNLDNYDAILGTPFLYQHQVAIAFNPSRVIVGSSEPHEMKGHEVTTISSASADLLNRNQEELRKQLRQEVKDLCLDSPMILPPLHDVNHTIPLIDEKKVYRSCPSNLGPDAFREQWHEKNVRPHMGCWRTATGCNTIPLIMIPNLSTTNGQPSLRTVFDKREQHANKRKIASPLPGVGGILRDVSRHKYRSLIDGKDAHEQTRVLPEHVSRTIVTTLDGTSESLVKQQGDCNAGTTYQTQMRHIFAPHAGVFVNDGITFSNSSKEHVKRLSVLRKEKLELGPSEMQSLLAKELLRSFVCAVGSLVPDCKEIRIPMGHLSGKTTESRLVKWDGTTQRAFNEVKKIDIVNDHRDQRRELALDYSEGVSPIWVITDGCFTGGGGYVGQEIDPCKTEVFEFWSGKRSSAQQNYLVHELELLALVETLKRFRGILHDATFTVRTDHKALIYLKCQKDLLHRQHWRLDVLNEFNVKIKCIPGENNEFADALSRICSDEPKGVVRVDSEYVNDADEPTRSARRSRTHPIYVDAALIHIMNAEFRRSSRLASKPGSNYKETRDRKPKTVWGKDNPTAVQEFPDAVESGSDSDEILTNEAMTLGTRGHLPAGRMLNTLWAQTTSNPNVPGGQNMDTLKMYP